MRGLAEQCCCSRFKQHSDRYVQQQVQHSLKVSETAVNIADECAEHVCMCMHASAPSSANVHSYCSWARRVSNKTGCSSREISTLTAVRSSRVAAVDFTFQKHWLIGTLSLVDSIMRSPLGPHRQSTVTLAKCPLLVIQHAGLHHWRLAHTVSQCTYQGCTASCMGIKMTQHSALLALHSHTALLPAH